MLAELPPFDDSSCSFPVKIVLKLKKIALPVCNAASLWENRVIPVIAVNGRGHYKSSKPRDKDYRKRGGIERFFSLLKMKLNLLNVRVKGLQRVTAHVNSCIFGYLLKYIL